MAGLHYPIDAFGILKVSMSGIRIEALIDRKEPRVPFPHKHDFFQILLIEKGAGFHKIDFEKFKISKNQIFIMKPGQIHSWQFSKQTVGVVIEFNRDAIDINLLHKLLYSKECFNLKKDEFGALLSIAEVMRQEFTQEKPYYDISLQGFLKGLLVKILREGFAENLKIKSESTVERFRNHLEANYKTQHRVEFYANELGMTPKSLTMQITRALGKAPRDLIQERFMLEAKRLLAYSQMGIAEIGHSLGFMDSNYFTRFFKQQEKLTPGEFRKTYAEISSSK